MNKKAVSPLIATVLLIAFAVSLGAVIMNWTVDSHVGEEGESENNVCHDISLKVINQAEGKAICLDRENKMITIKIDNLGNEVEGLRLSYIAKESNFIDYTQKIEAGVLKHIELKYDPALYGEPNNIKIVPFIKTSDLIFCNKKTLQFSEIEDCK